MIDSFSAFNAMNRIAGTHGLTLVLEDNCEQPRTCMETGRVYISRPHADWTKDDLLRALGEGYHEVGHHAPELEDIMPEMERRKIGFSSKLGSMVNAVEDWRNERNGFGDYPGRDDALDHLQTTAAKKGYNMLCDQMAAVGTKDAHEVTDPLMLDVLSWLYNQRSEWQPGLVVPSMNLDTISDYERFKQFNEELWAVRTAEEVIDLAEKIMDADPDTDLEEEKAEAAKQFEKEERGEGGEGKEASEGEGSGEGDEAAEGRSSSRKIPYEELMAHSHSEPGKIEGTYHSTIEYTDRKYDTYVPYQAHETTIMPARDLAEEPDRSYLSDIRDMWEGSRKLSDKVRRLFQSRTQSRRVGFQKRGRLDNRRLHAIPSGSKDVFFRNEDRIDTKGTVLYILSDASGSMSGDRHSAASAACILLEEAVRPLRIPVKLAAFTDCRYRGGLEHYIVKDWRETRTRNQMIDDYARIGNMLHQNSDGDSLLLAYRDLMSQSASRRILIVLSDGSPASDQPGDAATHLKQVIKHISKDVEVYGIGIQHHNVGKFYPDHKVIEQTSDLEKGLLEVVKSKLV